MSHQVPEWAVAAGNRHFVHSRGNESIKGEWHLVTIVKIVVAGGSPKRSRGSPPLKDHGCKLMNYECKPQAALWKPGWKCRQVPAQKREIIWGEGPRTSNGGLPQVALQVASILMPFRKSKPEPVLTHQEVDSATERTQHTYLQTQVPRRGFGPFIKRWTN